MFNLIRLIGFMPGDTARENGKKGGRPKARHTLEASALRAYIIEEVVKQKSALVKKLIEKAKGGDIAAIKELLDRTLGKSKEQVDITYGGKPIPILGNLSTSGNRLLEPDKKFHYDYPTEIGNLAPSSDKHKMVMGRIIVKADESYRFMQKRHATWNEIDRPLTA